MPPTFPETEPGEPLLLRFRLRQLFVFVSLLSLLCGLMVLTEGPWPWAIGATSVLVSAHVFGTLVGTRLRDNSDELLQRRSSEPGFVEPGFDKDQLGLDLLSNKARSTALPPSTPLANHVDVSRRCYWFVVGGAILGVALGGALLVFTIGSRTTWAGWAAGTLSCGVLGTWLAFLISSFGSIAWHAWRHANEHD